MFREARNLKGIPTLCALRNAPWFEFGLHKKGTENTARSASPLSLTSAGFITAAFAVTYTGFNWG